MVFCMDALIECRNLSRVYVSEGVLTQAVSEVSFSLKKGEFVSIMGPSGSGKSTLMHILGLLDRPTSGEYLFNGQNVSRFSENTLARFRNTQIGFVFQSFNLLPRTSVYENVELPLLYNIYKKEADFKMRLADRFKEILGFRRAGANREKVETALRSVGMEKRIEYKSNQLSGGEKQRVAIARALVNDPDILFADEPTGNLDSKSGLRVMQILQQLNSEGKTIVLVTHETYTAEHAKRIIRMRDGKIESDESLDRWRIASREKILK